MKKSITFLLVTGCWLFVSAQPDCSNNRYKEEVFTSFDLTSDIKYGENINLNGNNEELFLDVYQPSGDTETNRPLIIWAHGGSFVSGGKTEIDVKPLSEDFAKMGYVTASIDYRLGMNGIPFPGPDSVDATETVIRTVHDGRAAIRFFKKDFAENGNSYGIDTSLIFFGGVSAGGVIAVHLAYLDKENEMPSYVDTTQAGLGGGIAGNSGNPGYSANVAAIINSAGAIRDTAWIEGSNDTPIISFHGDQDGTVPFYTDIIYMLNVFEIMVVDGSNSIHIQTNKKGTNNCFVPFWGQDHVPHVTNPAYYDTLVAFTKHYLMQFICGEPYICSFDGTVGTEEKFTLSGDLKFYPNPATSQITFNLNELNGESYSVHVYDNLGRMVESYSNQINEKFILQRDGLTSGLYFVNFITEKGNYSGKVVFE
ncbi:T9SS type A sorting domain-containing protein [Bacteroidales bacterium AH-315-I05]|nr:T9SS type A sorting domain-containing protein [Bacteroidales bacterium AH-315-I05]